MFHGFFSDFYVISVLHCAAFNAVFSLICRFADFSVYSAVLGGNLTYIFVCSIKELAKVVQAFHSCFSRIFNPCHFVPHFHVPHFDSPHPTMWKHIPQILQQLRQIHRSVPTAKLQMLVVTLVFFDSTTGMMCWSAFQPTCRIDLSRCWMQ